VTASGTFANLEAAGRVSFGKGEIVVAPGLVLFEASAALDGKKIILEKSLCRLKSTNFTASGEIDLPIVKIRV